MKGIYKEIGFAILLGAIMPWLVFGLTDKKAENNDLTPEVTQMHASISVLVNGEPKVMELQEYLVGVLLCELPGDFHLEAKKAQAVVARTYTLRRVELQDKHAGCAVCNEPGCCQGYRSPQEYLSLGGSQKVIDEAKIAVEVTEGMVLTYNGQLIDATYFSCSGGQTEDALAVWGADIPYLQSVESPGEEQANHYSDRVVFTPMQFQKCLGVSLGGPPKDWFGKITYTKGGGVDQAMIGSVSYSGTTLRSALGLRSTAFSVSVENENIIITTRGYGHRVGMSQYGADAMARDGYSWEQILLHYYTDTKIEARSAP